MTLSARAFLCLSLMIVFAVFANSEAQAATLSAVVIEPDSRNLHSVADPQDAGPCKNGVRWRVVPQTEGRGLAQLESCGEKSPTLPIAFSCRSGLPKITVSVAMVQSLPRMLRGPFPVSLYGEGNGMRDADDQPIQAQIRQFQAMRVDGPGKGRLAFELEHIDPLFQALAAGESGYVNVIGQTLGFHLEGARAALTEAFVACGLPRLNVPYPSGTIQFAPKPL